MIKKSMLFVLLLTGPVSSDPIVSVGDWFAFAAPNPPYDPGQNLTLKLTLGYGDVSNTVGSTLWFSEPGIFDLSLDAGFQGFLSYATNGMDDPIYVTIADMDGHESLLPFSSGNWEWMFLGGFPDLFPLEITGAQLHVLDVFVGPLSNGGSGGTRVQWEFLGVPEPSTLGSLAISGFALCGGRRVIPAQTAKISTEIS